MIRVTLILVFVLLVCAAAAAQEVESGDMIRVKTTLVNSPVLVIGRDGKFAPNLKCEEFEVFENGVKQEIAYFAPDENSFMVAIMIDASRSALFDLQDIRKSLPTNGSRQFVLQSVDKKRVVHSTHKQLVTRAAAQSSSFSLCRVAA